MKLWCPTNYFSCDLHFVILGKVENRNISEELMKLCSPPEFFYKNMSHEQLLFTSSTFHDSSMGTKLKWFWKIVKLWSPPEFFTKTCLTNNYLSCDPHYVILAWVQSWNIFEKFMKLWSQSCCRLRLAIHLASFVLMSWQRWPKYIYSVTVTLSVFVPVLNTLVRLYSDLSVLWPNPQWSNVIIQM